MHRLVSSKYAADSYRNLLKIRHDKNNCWLAEIMINFTVVCGYQVHRAVWEPHVGDAVYESGTAGA